MDTSTIPQILQNIVQKVCTNENIKNFDIHLHQGNDKGAGFLGEITFLTIHDQATSNDLDIVIKKAFNDQTIRTTNPIRETFLNEIYFYSIVWPKLEQFQNDAQISNKFQSVPKCYMVQTDNEAELIVMQNLKKMGFVLVDKKKSLDSEHAAMICKTYGRFHAISFAMRVKQPEEYRELSDGLYDLWKMFLDGSFFKPSIEAHCKLAFETLVPGEDDEFIRKFRPFLKDGPGQFLEAIDYQGKNSVITHGDCWSNNLMFRYDNDSTLTDIQLIDWQICRKSSQVLDLAYCLYSSASQNIFDQLDHFLKVYHDSFIENLIEFGCDPSLYTFEDLKNDWKKHSKFGMIMAIMLIKMKLTDDDHIVDLTDMDALSDKPFEETFMETPYNEVEFKRRVRGLIRHMIDFGCL